MTSGSSGRKNIAVAVRCRPFNENEKAQAATRVVKINGEKTIIHNPGPTTGTKEHVFNFDHSYFWDTKNEQVFKDIGVPAVTNVINGINSSIIIYGQKSTGKDFTVAGGHDELGLVPRVCKEIFRLIEQFPSNTQFFVTASYAEVRHDILNDLLNPSGQDLKVSKHPQLGVFVEGLSELVCFNGEDLQELFEQGNRVSKILSNEHQNVARSRGSLLFCIDVQQKDLSNPDQPGLKSKLTIVNLADSDHMSEGLDKQDSGPVEKSVNALTNIIAVIADSNSRSNHTLTFDQSKLTYILQESFGGNCQTFMIATVSPADSDFQETLATLQCASKAKIIQNSFTRNKIDNSKVIVELRAEISRLRDKLTDKNFTKAPDREDVLQMEEKVRDLQVAKRQTWDEKERLSHQYEEERRINLANKGILGWVFDSMKKENKEMQEKLAVLRGEKDQLMIEYKERRKVVDEMKDELQNKITEYSKIVETGKNEEESKNKLQEIQEMKERLKQENDNLKQIKHKLKEIQEKQKLEKEEAKTQTSFLKGNTELRQRLQTEQRERFEKDNEATLTEEADRIKMESEQEKTDIQIKGAERTEYSTEKGVKLEIEIVELKAERSMMSLKIQAVENVKKRWQSDLELAYKQHKQETEVQQLQNFQTFRNYRTVFEEQKSAMEQRYRTLLEEAIQDAVFLSATNQDLMYENQHLKQDTAELKDKLCISGIRVDSPDDIST